MSLDQYLPVLLFILVGIAVGIIPQVLGYILGPNLPDAEKNGLPGISKLPVSLKVLLEPGYRLDDQDRPPDGTTAVVFVGGQLPAAEELFGAEHDGLANSTLKLDGFELAVRAVLGQPVGVLVLPASEAEAVARAALDRQTRGSATEKKVAQGAKLGELSGASAKVVAALAAKS